MFKEKREQGVPTDKVFRTIVEWSLPKHPEKKRKDALFVVFFGGLWLFCTLGWTIYQISDWMDWEFLDQHGKTQSAPLVDTDKYGCGRGSTCYKATYKYQDTVHKQEICEEKYKSLSNESTVEIIAAGNVSRITGTRPDLAATLIKLMVALSTGFLFLLWGVFVLLKIRSLKKYRY